MNIRNCLILGSGHSGTSMAAGVLSRTGYFMGKDLYPGDEGNPKGYFEDQEINQINEELLGQVVPPRPSGTVGELFFKTRPVDGQRWVAMVPPGSSISCPSHLAERIKLITKNEPFCLKDPRFCYTLPAWNSFLKDALFICVFRHPGATAKSIVKESQRYSENLYLDFNKALQIWEMMYTHILDIHYPKGGDWLFIHYEQFFDGSAFDKLKKNLNATLYCDFVEPKLNRSTATNTLPTGLSLIYQELCNKAEYNRI